MKNLVRVSVLLFVLVVISALYYVKPILNSAVALAARQSCSLKFAAGIPLSLARDTYVDRHIRPLGPYVSIELNEAAESAHASLLGVISSTAIHQPGYGCVLHHGQDIVKLSPYELVASQPVPINERVANANFDVEALRAVIEASFKEPNAQQPRQTMAVLVLSDGELVAEKYADGVTQQTPLPGFSMAKSMTATMIGLLVSHQKLDVLSVVPNAGRLSEAGVTYDQLLRMISGIGVDETGSGRDKNSIMLTQTHDSAQYAVQQGLHDGPGETYEYTGGNAVVLSKQFVEIAGEGDASAAYEFLAEKLLRPLGISSVVLETDGVGTFLGSSFMLASALDWAKLGQLYLQDGVWEGTRLLPVEWTRYVSTKTPQSAERDYGAGFWVAETGGRDSRHEHLPQPPQDAFFMHGMMNQAVYILPGQSLVVVRLGATRSYLESGEWELLAGVLSAYKHDSERARTPEQRGSKAPD